MTTINENKLRDVSARAARILNDRGVDGRMGLYINGDMWTTGQVVPKIAAHIIGELTPEEAKNLGWALYMLGKYGEELRTAPEHEIDDFEFFKD